MSSWLTASLVKLAKGSNSSHGSSIGALLVAVELAPQFGGKGRLQLDSMFVPPAPPPQTMLPSETWQDSVAACLLLSTAVCCCPLDGVGWEGLGLVWFSAAFKLCPFFPKCTLKLLVEFRILVASYWSFLLFFSPTWRCEGTA